MEKIASLKKLEVELQNSNHIFIVTGANGWIGKATVMLLAQYLGKSAPNRIIPCSSSLSHFNLQNGTKLKCRKLEELGSLPKSLPYIIFHFAFLTKDKLLQMPVSEFAVANLEIRKKITDFIKETKPEGIIYASSGAVYNNDRTISNDITVNPYGFLKAQDESHFLTVSADIGTKLVIPRIFNIAGYYINKWEIYALSSFIMQALNHKHILINAKHPVIRSYVNVIDVINLCLLYLLDKQQSSKENIFDTVGTEELELTALAELVRSCLGEENIPIIREGYDAELLPDRYVGCDHAQNILLNKFQYQPFSIQTSINQTIKYIKNVEVGI